MGGPARCLNSDHKANAKFVTSTPLEIKTVAILDISPGDDITVNYGIHYFEDDSRGCLCKSCESHSRDEEQDVGDRLPTGRYSLRRGKRRAAEPAGGNPPCKKKAIADGSSIVPCR